MENPDEDGFSEEIIKFGPRRNYLVPICWLTSILLIGGIGYVVGGAKEPPRFLATVGEAWSNMFAGGQKEFVEIVDTHRLTSSTLPMGEPDRVIVGDEINRPPLRAVSLNKSGQPTVKINPADLVGLKIREVVFDVEGADDGLERVKIFNSGSNNVLIENFSLQYLRVGGDYSTVKKKNFVSGNAIPAGGEFVVGMSCSTAVPCGGVDMSWSQSLANDGGIVYLVSDQENITGEKDLNIITSMAYGTALP
jgi:hypothetical protein